MKRSHLLALSAVVLLGLGMAGRAQAQGRGRGGAPPMGHPAMGGGQPATHAPGAPGAATKSTSATRSGKSVEELLQQNTKLSQNLQNLLGPNVNLQQAAAGFKNLGQFVAAVHVSKNLNIPFDQLKSEIMKEGSLGKAIKALDPSKTPQQIRTEVRKAEQQARQDIRSSRQG